MHESKIHCKSCIYSRDAHDLGQTERAKNWPKTFQAGKESNLKIHNLCQNYATIYLFRREKFQIQGLE